MEACAVTERPLRVMPAYRCSTVSMPTAISLKHREFHNEWGECCEVVDIMDDEGEYLDIDDPDEHQYARVAICRHPLAEGGWYSIDLEDYSFDGRGLMQ